MDEVYRHLRKQGLVPERKKKEKSPKTTYADFDVQKHGIGSISSSTLWEVTHVHICRKVYMYDESMCITLLIYWYIDNSSLWNEVHLHNEATLLPLT